MRRILSWLHVATTAHECDVVADTLRRRLPSRIMRTNARETPRPVDAAVEECDATAMNWLRRVHALMEGRDMRCKWSMIAACALVGLTAAGAWLYGQQKTGPVADRRSLQGRGRPKLCRWTGGTIHSGGRDYARATVWVPVSDVTRMSEFGNLDHLVGNRENLRQYEQQRMKVPGQPLR
jgi:hypothetical protein